MTVSTNNNNKIDNIEKENLFCSMDDLVLATKLRSGDSINDIDTSSKNNNYYYSDFNNNYDSNNNNNNNNRRKPKDLEDKNYYNEYSYKEITKENFLEIIKDFRFKYLFMYCLVIFIFPFVMNFMFKSVGLFYLMDDKFVTLSGSVGAFTNGISRLLLPICFKNWRFTCLGLFIGLIQLVVSFTFIDFANSKLLFIISVILFEITYAYSGVVILMCEEIFKEKMLAFFPYSTIAVSFSLCIGMFFIYLSENYSNMPLFPIIGLISFLNFYFLSKLISISNNNNN